MISHRRGAGVTIFEGRLYVVGGSDGQASLNWVEIYDFETETWTHGPSMSIARANIAVTMLDERLYAVGGFSGKHFLNSIECLLKDKKEWSCFAPRMSCSSGSESSADSDAQASDSETAPQLANGSAPGGGAGGQRKTVVKQLEKQLAACAVQHSLANIPNAEGDAVAATACAEQASCADYNTKHGIKLKMVASVNGAQHNGDGSVCNDVEALTDLGCQTALNNGCSEASTANGHHLDSMTINGYS